MSNIIDAIVTLIERNNFSLINIHSGNNRLNQSGYALEDYVKNLFANSFDDEENERLEKWCKTFSYLGNDANPPDMMLKNGDAIEVKKIQSVDSAIALNSSYPKHMLLSSGPLISKACREAEVWREKDIIYTVGCVKGTTLKHLCMVYGRDYCASEECYEKIRLRIKHGVETIPNVTFAPTRELGRINRVDPLGITYLRVRGMWHIENVWKVFEYIHSRNVEANFTFMCLINFEKWATLENKGELLELKRSYPALKITDVRIKNPDNPAKLKDAKLIVYEI